MSFFNYRKNLSQNLKFFFYINKTFFNDSFLPFFYFFIYLPYFYQWHFLKIIFFNWKFWLQFLITKLNLFFNKKIINKNKTLYFFHINPILKILLKKWALLFNFFLKISKKILEKINILNPNIIGFIFWLNIFLL